MRIADVPDPIRPAPGAIITPAGDQIGTNPVLPKLPQPVSFSSELPPVRPNPPELPPPATPAKAIAKPDQKLVPEAMSRPKSSPDQTHQFQTEPVVVMVDSWIEKLFGWHPSRRSVLLGSLVALIGFGLMFYFGYYANPNVILSQALGNTGRGYNSLVDTFAKVENSRFSTVTGSGSYSYSIGGKTTSGSLSYQNDGKRSDTLLDFGTGASQIKAELRTIKPSFSDPTTIYLNTSGISKLGSQLGVPSLDAPFGQLDGKWVVVDRALLDSFSTNQRDQPAINLPSQSQTLSALQAIGKVNQQYVFTTNPSNGVLKVLKKYGAVSVDGHNTYHYLLGFNKINVKRYVSAQRDAIKSSAIGSWLSQNGYTKKLDDRTLDLEKAADQISDADNFELWANGGLKPTVYKLRFTTPGQPQNYHEVGTDYRGGSKYPLFVYSQTKSQSGNLTTNRLTATIDSKTYVLGLKLHSRSDKSPATTLDAQFDLRPSHAKVSVSAPSTTVPLSQAINQLGLGSIVAPYTQPLSPASAVETTNPLPKTADDRERVSDIQAIQSLLESYNDNSDQGNYPSFSQANSPAWRKSNMPNLTDALLKDPSGSQPVFIAKPASGGYAYQPTDDNGDSCEDDASFCTRYTLTATLSDGQQYIRREGN